MFEPKLTSRINVPVRKVVMGDACILALTKSGRVFTWGRDSTTGCLGLGSSVTSADVPTQVEGVRDVVDIQMGSHHVVALTKKGEVYCWGDGEMGQLGNKRHGESVKACMPALVEGLPSDQPVQQVVVMRKSTYALTANGAVYAWGDNTDNVLGLGATSHVPLSDTPVLLEAPGAYTIGRLEIYEMGTVVAYVEDSTKGDGRITDPDYGEDERNLFEGIDEMSKTMKDVQSWWTQMLDLKHGQPYDLPQHQGLDGVEGSLRNIQVTQDLATINSDMEAKMEQLEWTYDRLSDLCNNAIRRLEINRNRSRKNVKFILCMFVDEVRLRREKVSRTICVRRITELKRQSAAFSAGVNHDLSDVGKVIATNRELDNILEQVKATDPIDVFTQEMKTTIWESIECRMQLHEARIAMLQGEEDNYSNCIMPALKLIRSRWEDLRSFSLYGMYHQHLRQLQQGTRSDSDNFKTLVNMSNAKIDQIIYLESDQVMTHDILIPPLCYDLLKENAELRKMVNTCQLQVLSVHTSKKETRKEPEPGAKQSPRRDVSERRSGSVRFAK